MVSDSVLELLTTSALPLEDPVLGAPGTERTLAKSTLLVKPMPPPRTLTCGSGAGATPVAMAMTMPKLRRLAYARNPTNTSQLRPATPLLHPRPSSGATQPTAATREASRSAGAASACAPSCRQRQRGLEMAGGSVVRE